MRRVLVAVLSLVALAVAPVAGAQTLRKVQTRAIVRDSACAGEAPGWRARDTTFRTMTEATTLSRTRIACPVVPPPPAPPDTITPPPPVTVGTWANVTPANVNLTSSLSCGNYGVENVQVDPAQPSNAYAFFHCQGLWRSTDYGATWQGPISPASVNDCAGGIRIGQDGTMHLACIRGAAVGYWRSADRGLTWTRHAVAPAAQDRQDFYPPSVDPYDPNHLLMAGHEQDVLVESVNGGLSWTSVARAAGMNTGSGTNAINFVNTGSAATTRTTYLWLAQQTDVFGTWRTANGGASWVRVDKNEHLHGFSETYQPNASGVLYMAGVYSALGWGVLRSADYGVTWARVNGADGSMRTIIGTSSTLIASASYPGGLGTSYGPSLWRAAQPGTGAWTRMADPPGMLQGASQMVVTSDGTRTYVLSANYGAGLWRYVELGATVPAPPVAVPPTTAPPVVTPPPVVVPPPVVTPPLGGTNGVPLDTGVSGRYIRANPVIPNFISYEGNFRTRCNIGRIGTFDPIVYPGQATAGHEHMFFGNIGLNQNSTTTSLRLSGNSTCWGGIVNRTGYWVPTVRDVATGQLQIPSQLNVYYKSHIVNADSIRVIPAGLVMIAGNKNNSSGPQAHANWNCSRTWNQQSVVDGFIPNCAVGEHVILSVEFPECWNGRDLDSPDHQSHMAYAPYTGAGTSRCPASHPVPLPHISENFFFPVTATSQPLRWRLSSDMYSPTIRGGRSAHADWMNGWDQTVLATFTWSCINARRDCTVDLGDGRSLFYKP